MVRLLILALAVSSGGAAAWMTLAGEPPQAPLAARQIEILDPPMEDVLVAAVDLGQGKTLDDASLRWQSWPKDAVAPGYISRSAQPDAATRLRGSLVRSSFQLGEPMREDKLAPAGSGYMAALLPAGKRAVAVRVSAESTAGGFVLPNDRVDVVHTVSRAGAEGVAAETISRTVLRNIRVLAVDQSQNTDPANPQPVVVGETATLELDHNQVEIITAAEASGTLSLALRSVADNDEALPPRASQNSTVRVHRKGLIDAVKVSSHRAPASR